MNTKQHIKKDRKYKKGNKYTQGKTIVIRSPQTKKPSVFEQKKRVKMKQRDTEIHSSATATGGLDLRTLKN